MYKCESCGSTFLFKSHLTYHSSKCGKVEPRRHLEGRVWTATTGSVTVATYQQAAMIIDEWRLTEEPTTSLRFI